MDPIEDLTEMELKIVLAVVEIHETWGRVVIRDVCRRVDRNVSTVWKHLHVLRGLGWVTWDDEKRGTLRPTVRRVCLWAA